MNPLRLLQQQIDARLEANARIVDQNVRVLSRLKGSSENDVDALLGQSGGMCLFVFVPEPLAANPNLPGPELGEVEIRVACNERPDRNGRAEFDCWDLWFEIVSERGLHRWKPALASCGMLSVAQRPFEDATAKPKDRIFDAIFRARLNLKEIQ